MEEVRAVTYKYAVKNAFEHEGKAQIGAVVGKVKALFPEVDLKKVMPLINEIVSLVNKMHKDILNSEYSKFNVAGWELKHVEKEKALPELDWFKPGMKLITRVAPNPSGAMHFGHARPAVLTDEYVKKYGGEYILRFDDTDPKIKIPVLGIEKEFLAEFKWLGINIDKTVNASDRLDRYYAVIEKLISDGNAYICDCESEEWRKLIWESKPCKCRTKSTTEQLILWKKMLAHEIKEEEAVVRIKSDLNDKDPSTRDWWLARVVNEVNHPNKKAQNKHVWPSYNLASGVDDHEMGINFIIRGQEHVQNEDKQKILYKYFNWEYPHTFYHGKISKVGDMILSKSKIKELIEKGGLKGDDDPRLATLKSFRRRGFTPEAIRKVILSIGLNPNEAKISLDAFASANKEILGEVNEYSFFEEPSKVEIIGVGKGEIENYGEKIKFSAGAKLEIFVEKKEFEKYLKKNDTIVRLKKAFNAKVASTGKLEFVSFDKENYPTLSWTGETIPAEILLADGSMKKGVCPKSVLNAKGIIHLEGIGFVNIEEKKKDCILFVYSYD
ncbi:MAG: glutamate--tRNA ligase family protein [Candidatus Diapherotrites archaeon]|nr:glutamate--tRNA ligase family protein [Candidatus Diapherotrites archaeon]